MTLASVLDSETHKRLIEDMPTICQQAGVPANYIQQSMRNHCGEAECKWVINFKRLNETKYSGLTLVGDHLEVRSLALAGALIRNFIDARVYTLQRVIDEHPTPTVLIIPNFYISAIDCKPHHSWKIDQIYSLLLDRMSLGLQTVIGVTDMKNMEAVYGTNIVKHLRDNYVMSGG